MLGLLTLSVAQMARRCKSFPYFSFVFVGVMVLTSAVRSGWSQSLPAITDDLDVESLRLAIGRSIAYLQKLPPERVVGEQPRRLTAAEVRDGLLAFEKLLVHWPCSACLAQEINAHFELIPSSSSAQMSEVLFTGYYQPVLDGSLRRPTIIAIRFTVSPLI